MSKTIVKVFVKSELKQHELASVLGVTRMTVNNWICGRRTIHPMLKLRVIRVAMAINKAIEISELPYVGELTGPARLKRIRRIVATNLTKLPTQA